MICRDPYVRLLSDFGYSTIRLPRAQFEPLTLLQQVTSNSMRLFGQLAKHLTASPDYSLPEVSRGRRVANLSGGRTESLQAKVGLEILGGVVQALGGSAVGFGALYRSAESIQFEFSDVLEDSVDVGDVDLYMAGVQHPRGLVARRLAEEGSLYIVLATLSATRLLVSAEFGAGAKLEGRAPAVHGLVAVDLGVTGDQARTWTVSYESNEPLKFAFKAIQVFASEDRYTLKSWGSGSLEAFPDSELEVNQLVVEDELVELDAEARPS